jgi:glutathione S-transferase
VSTPLQLWQTEWCPASRRVRLRLTELGVEYVARQVPVEREKRGELVEATRQTSIPALVDRGRVVVGGDPILDYLDSRFPEPREALRHRAKAAKARERDLEEACPRLALTTR